MLKFLIRGSVSVLKWVLCGIGVLALVVLALLATPLQPVPELQSISRARASVDLSSLPAISSRPATAHGSASGITRRVARRPAVWRL
jgi:hypothetical protein